jgi:hypothetical protein
MESGVNGFYCNMGALNPAERARHKALTDKLLKMRRRTVELANAYEFEFRTAEVTVGELADWVASESKCCPFFDFQINLQNGGAVLTLRLAGAEGINAFIHAEFALDQ